jgi:hypothetical protein
MPPRRLDRAAGVLLVAAYGDGYGPATQAAIRAARVLNSGMDPATVTAGPGLAWAGMLALAHLRDAREMAESVRAAVPESDDPLTADACVLWAAAIRTAVRDEGSVGPAAGLGLIPATRRTHWAWWIEQAEQQPPSSFTHNDAAVPLLQASWSAIARTPAVAESPADGIFACSHLVDAVNAAAEVGPVIAATAGALLGARWGASAVPFDRLRTLAPLGASPGPKGTGVSRAPLDGPRCNTGALGDSGPRAAELVRLAALVAGGGRDDVRGWPSLARRALYPHRVDPAVVHPADPGVMLGGLGARDALSRRPTGPDRPPGPQAVVSLCQIGHADFEDIPAGDHLEFWLVDHPGDNNQQHFVIDQAARAVAAFRAEGKRVFLHCHAGLSRTPAVAARYACLTAGTDPATAFAQVAAATGRPTDRVNPELRAAVYELAGEVPPEPGDDPLSESRSHR